MLTSDMKSMFNSSAAFPKADKGSVGMYEAHLHKLTTLVEKN